MIQPFQFSFANNIADRLHSCRARFLLYLHNYLQTFAVFFTNYFWHHYPIISLKNDLTESRWWMILRKKHLNGWIKPGSLRMKKKISFQGKQLPQTIINQSFLMMKAPKFRSFFVSFILDH